MTDALIDSVALGTAATLGVLLGGLLVTRATRDALRRTLDVPAPHRPRRWFLAALGGGGAGLAALSVVRAVVVPIASADAALPSVLGVILGLVSLLLAVVLWRSSAVETAASPIKVSTPGEALDAATTPQPIGTPSATTGGPIDVPPPSRLAALLIGGSPGPDAPHVSTDPAEFDARLMHANRMQSIGSLAGGIAHDFNNLLTSILTSAEMAREALPDEHGIAPDLEEIRRAGTRASELTRQLLTFARRDVIRPRVIDANSLVGNLATMLRRLLGETITLRISLGKDLPLLFADPAQLEQVIVNLAVNARDAMPRGGELQLRTYRGSALHLPAGQAPGSGVVLEVQDSGVGMSDAVRERLFEPFFTTKTPGRGTGLGLATCQSIVGSTGGEIVVDSLEGEGTTFRLWFPTTEELDEVRTPPVHEAHALAAGGAPQVILLVEDDADVRASTARVLRRAGYDVLDAADGDAALQLMASRTAPVDVVITDIVMPRVGGAELARRLRERWPDLHVLYMSGYPRDSTEVAEVELTGAHVLAKPYTPAILLFELRLRLDATRPA